MLQRTQESSTSDSFIHLLQLQCPLFLGFP